ncbi:unnamed protein product [Gadus morhua 'NCC']
MLEVLGKVNKPHAKLSEERRRLWLAKLNQDLRGKNLDNVRICSAHFLSGKRSDLYQKDDPDWVPSVGMTAGGRCPHRLRQRLEPSSNTVKDECSSCP